MTGFPTTAETDWCGKFSAHGGLKAGTPPKLSDEAILKMVVESCQPFEINGTTHGEAAWHRGDLVWTLWHECGMAKTPAYKRVEGLIKKGLLQCGENPFPKEGSREGLYVWPTHKPWLGQEVPAEMGADQEEMFVAAVRSIADSEESAVSMRGLWKKLDESLPMSLTSVHRKVHRHLETGDIVQCSAGYYAPSVTE